MTLALALPLIFVGILWIIIAPLHVEIVVPDPLRPSFNYTTCTSKNWIFGYVIAGLVYAYLGITAVLAFAVRGAYSVFNEAEPIASTVYLLTFTISVIGATQLSEVGLISTSSFFALLIVSHSVYDRAMIITYNF
jgi:hypothetical protein